MKRGILWAVWLILCGCESMPWSEEAPGSSATATTASAAVTAASSTAVATASATSADADQSEAPPEADPSRLQLEGKFIQGGLVQARVDPGTNKLKFPGHRAVISAEGEFLIAFYRNAPKQEKMTVTFPDGAVLEHTFTVEQRTYEVDKIDGLPEHMVRLDPERKKKLHAANTRIDAARKRYTKKAYYREGFIWPCTGRITSRYGQKRILNGTDGGLHWGVDIATPLGTPVKAPAGGTISFVEKSVPLAGHTLVIDHGHGLSSTFIHLATFAKKVGDEVAQGDVVATVGMTGRSNGPHLDWRMNLFETRIDPELLVPPMDDGPKK